MRVNLEKATMAASSVASHPRYMCMHACRLLALLSQHSIISTASSQTVTRSDSNSLSSSTKPALEFTSGLAPYDHHMLRSSISYPTVAFSPHHQQVRLRFYNKHILIDDNHGDVSPLLFLCITFILMPSVERQQEAR